jgi:hypothetical protein
MENIKKATRLSTPNVILSIYGDAENVYFQIDKKKSQDIIKLTKEQYLQISISISEACFGSAKEAIEKVKLLDAGGDIIKPTSL